MNLLDTDVIIELLRKKQYEKQYERASKASKQTSKAFPKGIKTFPMRIVAIIRLRKPVMAPEIGPTETARSREGRAER